MVEDIEELSFQVQLHLLSQREPFGQTEVVPEEIGATQGIAAEVSELAILRAVAAIALSCAGIDRRHKSVRIEALNRAQLRDTRGCMVLIERHSRNETRKLGTASLHNISIRRIRRAEHRDQIFELVICAAIGKSIASRKILYSHAS
jgi:hypothetical protein